MSDILIDNKKIYAFETQFLHLFGLLTKLTMVLFLIGFFQTKPSWFLEFNFGVKVILALFLIYRFNSYRKQKIEFTELDRKVCYSAGIYILLISFVDYVDHYTDFIRQKIIFPYTLPLLSTFKKSGAKIL
jgi:hypothetical protein